MLDQNSLKAKHLIELLTPSAMSSVFCVIVSIAVTVSAIFINRFKSSSLRLNLDHGSASISNSHLVGGILQNQIVLNLPLILFWAAVGLMIYLIAVDIVKSIQSVFDLREELEYANVHRNQLIRDVVTRLVTRLVIVAVWLPYFLVFFHKLIPLAVRLAILGSSSSGIFLIAGYVVLSVVVTSVALHVQAILLRLLFLRPRLFSKEL